MAMTFDEYQQKAIDLAGGTTVPAAWVDTQKKKLDEYKAVK